MIGNNNEIEKKLWNAADQLRANSELSSQEYSAPVLGLIFLRYADYKFTKVEDEIKKRQPSDSRRKISKADYQAKGVMSLPDNARYSYLLNLPEGRNIGKAVNDAMKAIEGENEELKGVLPQTYSRFENDTLIALLKQFSNIPMDIEGDVFGKIYEYFLGKFAMSEGKKGGEFFTPTSIVKLIVDVIEPFHGRIYDPACGSGGMFVQNESIAAEGYIIREPHEPYGEYIIDLSQIDFEALRKRFLDGQKNTQIARLKAAISAKLDRMVRFNKSRIDYLEKFQQLIDEYNSGAINIEVFFDKLLVFAKKLNEEEKRGISENLSEEELAVFDLLNKPDLTDKERRQVKLAAKNLLNVLRGEKLVLDWRKRQQTRADVLLTIRTILDKELPRSYTPDLFQQKCDFLYQHIYDSYYGAGKGIY